MNQTQTLSTPRTNRIRAERQQSRRRNRTAGILYLLGGVTFLLIVGVAGRISLSLGLY